MANSGPGALATENDPPASSKVVPRAASEEAAASVAARGVRTAIVRLPQVHDTVKQGLVTYAIHVAREKGVSGVRRRWAQPLAGRSPLRYRPAIPPGTGKSRHAGDTFHAVAEEGVPVRDIAEAIGRGLRVPLISLARNSPLNISVGLRPSLDGTSQPPAPSPAKSWNGILPAPALSPISTTCATRKPAILASAPPCRWPKQSARRSATDYATLAILLTSAFTKAKRSWLIVSASVVHMPCGKPG